MPVILRGFLQFTSLRFLNKLSRTNSIQHQVFLLGNKRNGYAVTDLRLKLVLTPLNLNNKCGSIERKLYLYSCPIIKIYITIPNDRTSEFKNDLTKKLRIYQLFLLLYNNLVDGHLNCINFKLSIYCNTCCKNHFAI